MLGLQQLRGRAVAFPGHVVVHLEDERGIWTIRPGAQHLQQAPPCLVLVACSAGRSSMRRGHGRVSVAASRDRPRRCLLLTFTLPTFVPKAAVHNPWRRGSSSAYPLRPVRPGLAIGSLLPGMAGTCPTACWPGYACAVGITAAVSCLRSGPVPVLGMGAALGHMLRSDAQDRSRP